MITNIKTYIWILLLVFPILSYGQDQKRINEVMKVIDAQDSISEELFLDTTIIKNMYLSHTLEYRRVWTDINDSIKSIHQFYDIRIRFESDSAALAFHKEYMDESSEFGPEIKSKFKSPAGVMDLHVFTQTKKMSKVFLEPYGFQALCYLFVVDNYIVKFYITCLKTYKPSYFIPHIEQAVNKIKTIKK